MKLRELLSEGTGPVLGTEPLFDVAARVKDITEYSNKKIPTAVRKLFKDLGLLKDKKIIIGRIADFTPSAHTKETGEEIDGTFTIVVKQGSKPYKLNGEATKNDGKHDEGGYLSYLDLRPLGLEEFKAKNIDDGYPIDDMDFYDMPNF